MEGEGGRVGGSKGGKKEGEGQEGGQESQEGSWSAATCSHCLLWPEGRIQNTGTEPCVEVPWKELPPCRQRLRTGKARLAPVQPWAFGHK